jgi:hypothetical protein
LTVPGTLVIDNYWRVLICRLALCSTAETLTELLLVTCLRGMGMEEVDVVGWGMWKY